jgi:hypothetical protein
MESSLPNLRIDRPSCRAWVNAGWTVAKLYERVHTQYPRFFLPSQPAGPAFTIAGMVLSSVHGAAVGFGLIGEAVRALRVIGADGVPRIISDEAELRCWRCSFGLLGVITHVELQLVRLRDFRAVPRELSLPMPLARDEPQSLEALRAAVLTDTLSEPWQEYYFNPYTGRLLRIAWAMSTLAHDAPLPPPAPIQCSPNGSAGGAFAPGAPKLMMCDVLTASHFAPNFVEKARWSKAGCASAIDLTMSELARALQADALTGHDLLFLEHAATSVCLCYFLPVDRGLLNLHRALAAVARIATELRESDAPYKFDLPVSFRFVRGSERALLSPLSSTLTTSAAAAGSAAVSEAGLAGGSAAGSEAQLYLAIELPTFTGRSIDPTFGEQDSEAMRSFLDAFARIEREWRAISPIARPHLGKLFGLSRGADGRMMPFDADVARAAIAPHKRARFREKMLALDPEGIFGREWADVLLGGADAPAAAGAPAHGGSGSSPAGGPPG